DLVRYRNLVRYLHGVWHFLLHWIRDLLLDVLSSPRYIQMASVQQSPFSQTNVMTLFSNVMFFMTNRELASCINSNLEDQIRGPHRVLSAGRTESWIVGCEDIFICSTVIRICLINFIMEGVMVDDREIEEAWRVGCSALIPEKSKESNQP
ncbi:hypothetical protein L9F63_007439, partial [Diploptera punctata]